jgi:hypothetical protein
VFSWQRIIPDTDGDMATEERLLVDLRRHLASRCLHDDSPLCRVFASDDDGARLLVDTGIGELVETDLVDLDNDVKYPLTRHPLLWGTLATGFVQLGHRGFSRGLDVATATDDWGSTLTCTDDDVIVESISKATYRRCQAEREQQVLAELADGRHHIAPLSHDTHKPYYVGETVRKATLTNYVVYLRRACRRSAPNAAWRLHVFVKGNGYPMVVDTELASLAETRMGLSGGNDVVRLVLDRTDLCSHVEWRQPSGTWRHMELTEVDRVGDGWGELTALFQRDVASMESPLVLWHLDQQRSRRGWPS